jgi:hypothetical protein
VTADDALEVIVELAEALDAAVVELRMLSDTEVPIPDKIAEAVEQRDALAATLKRVVPENEREAAKVIYREALAKATCTLDGPKVPVLPEVIERFAAAQETLRRRATLDSELRAALRGAFYRSDLPDC